MGIKVSLLHRTSYTFDRRVQLGPHSVRLRPAPHSRTPVESYSLKVSPDSHFLNWQQDPFGNYVARLVFPEKTSKLEVTVGLVADLEVINPFDFFVEEYAENFGFAYEPLLAADLEPYLRPIGEPGSDGPGPLARSLVHSLQLDSLPIVDALVVINGAVNAAVGYSVRMEPGVQTPEETLQRAIGSCRDSAWLLVSVLRQLGLAARFVSGYLVQLTADEKSLNGPSGPTEDFTDLHAWTEVYIPGAGWVGLDPTSALFAGEGHIPLSATPHPSSAAPISGVLEPVNVELEFVNEVTRFHEDPRVTKPYTEEQWLRIDALGEKVDGLLKAEKIALTMGGEPTFVSADDMTSPQWNTEADGAQKRQLATELSAKLTEAFARGALMQRSQGKWYPGEPLPRWQIATHWRTDGISLWPRANLLADPWSDEPSKEALGQAEALALGITEAFGLDAAQLQPAFEDPLAHVVAEVRRPMGAPADEPGRSDIADLDAGVPTPTAWVLPLHPAEQPEHTDSHAPWASPTWAFRRGRLVLSPGDSPAGLRLPLDAVDWSPAEPDPEPSYSHAKPPLRRRKAMAEPVSAEGAPLTAVVIEARHGFVYVFLPPLDHLDDFADLVALIGRQVTSLKLPVVIEGYGPPPDARLKTLMVTPDPGVIEVNLQPTSSWAELREVTQQLYASARETRLSTEKFDLDGLHTGTGGGNHITLGGVTPDESPLLKRPDLLVSMLTYWQQHPSLSYVFSGRFVGPTSQAPRADEARPDAAYELEIAFAEIERLTEEKAQIEPWIVDRALRHLLTDLTGNTHRSEFCIDKLYSPDSSRGRLGLLELRGFEMPPHPQMGLVQALLVRALVAWFARTPYTGPLTRWGTDLHERFLTPHGAQADLEQVVADLQRAGIEMEADWFAPFVEFRFPRVGTTVVDGVGIELRSAIEAWRVLGEEVTGGGTARYVDSSVERMQVQVTGLVPGRHLVTCNGVPVPLAPTGRAGEAVASVRYRAWQPWSSLHPTIEAHAPLQFDLIDLAAGRSLGGCTYHVVHPGGRSYEDPPVNAQVAEARRASRFEEQGFMTGNVDVAGLEAAARRTRSAEYPRTLDLRRHVPRSWGR